MRGLVAAAVAAVVGLAAGAAWWTFRGESATVVPPAPSAPAAGAAPVPPHTPPPPPLPPLPAPAPAATPPLHLGPASVCGRVTEAAGGKPVPGALVRVHLSDPAGRADPVEAAAVSGPGGAWTIDGLPEWRLDGWTVSHAGFVVYPDALVDIVPWPEVLEGSLPLVRDAALRRGGTIRGRTLTAAGKPVPGVKVTAFASRKYGGEVPLETLPVVSGPDGTYRIEGVWEGRVGLRPEADGWYALGDPSSARDLAVDGDKEPGELEVRLPRGGEVVKDLVLEALDAAIEGRVVDGAGRPVSDAGVGAVYGDRTWVKDLPVWTDAMGAFRIERLASDPVVRAYARAPDGREGRSDPFPLPEGGTVKDVVVTLGPGPQLHGFVRAGTVVGPPVPGATVRFVVPAKSYLPKPTDEELVAAPMVITGADGGFLFEGLPRGEGHLLVRGPSGEVVMGPKATVGSEEKDPVVVLPESRSVQLAVRLPDGAPAAGVAVEVWPGDLCSTRPVLDDAVLRLDTDAGGLAAIPVPGEGARWVRATAPGGLEATGLLGYKEESLELALAPRTVVAGRLVEATTGMPIPGVHLEASVASATGKSWLEGDWSTDSAEDGSFRIEDLPAGTLYLGAGGEDTGWQRVWIPDVPSGDPTFTLRLRRNLVLAGILLDEEGRPAGAVDLEFLVKKPGTKDEGCTRGPSGWEAPSCTTRSDGSFRVEGLVNGVYAAYLGDEKDPRVRRIAGDLAPGRTDLVLRLRAGKRLEGAIGLDDPPEHDEQDERSWAGRPSDLVDSLKAFDASTGREIPIQPAQQGDGRFSSVSLDPAGTFDLVLEPHYPGRPFGILRGVHPGAADLVLHAHWPMSTLRGWVLLPDGTGAGEGMPVKAVAVDAPPHEPGTSVAGYASEDGSFLLPVRAGFRWRVTAGGPDSIFAPTPAADPVDAGTSGISIRLIPGAAIAGKVLLPRGKPAWLYGLRGVFEGGETTCSLGDLDGSFTLEGLPPGPVHFYEEVSYDDDPAFDFGVVKAPAKDVVLKYDPARDAVQAPPK